ncbi:MAG: cobalt ECF transporter T component CbiQ [Candidatus Omnitrophota bacterium]
MRHSYLDQYSELDSFTHRLDPRIKIAVFTVIILFVIFTPLEKINPVKSLFLMEQTERVSLMGFTPLSALNKTAGGNNQVFALSPASLISFSLYGSLLAALILLSRIPPVFIVRRLLTVLSFAFLIAIFLPFLGEGRILRQCPVGFLKLDITDTGLLIFLNVVIKSFLSALCMIVLVATTKFPDILKALEELKFPRLLTMIASFMYRYFFVIEDELMIMNRAREARSAGGSNWFQAKAMANILGILFVRSYERSELVYLAMCSRGFEGKIKTLSGFNKIRSPDIIFLFIIILLLTGARLAGIYYG